VIGQPGGDKLIADPADAQRLSLAQLAAQRGHDGGRGIGEELFDRDREGTGEPECCVDGRHVLPTLDRGHELATDPGAGSKLSLSEPALQPTCAQSRFGHHHCHDLGRVPGFWHRHKEAS
jgi:hypothetical protein